MTAAARFGPSLLLLICLGGIADWLGASTHRLYVDDDSVRNLQVGSVWEHFALKKNQVTPQIITRDDARMVFPLRSRVPHQLRFALKAKPASSFEIFWNHDGTRKQLAAETAVKNGSRAVSLPTGAGELEIIEHGSIAWLDLRTLRCIFLWPLYLVAAVGLAFVIVTRLRAHTRYVAELLTLFITVALCLLIAESTLRHFRLGLPPMILAARSPFGLIPPDGRWVDPARYKLRLRSHLDTYAEWREGDITRLGFIAKNLSRPGLHRFGIRTDAEGFRNATTREKIDVAALGDSFTDGTTSAEEEAWPARLEKLTGWAVQNYGTSGFGPQQERYVFQDFAAQHHPRWTVLAFFAGNDLHDAEAFADWESGAHRLGEELTGAKLPADYRRYQEFYLWTIVRVAAESLVGSRRHNDARKLPVVSDVTSARFDRGMFDVPVNGHLLQFAFFPPYLQKLGQPRAEIEASRGWELTRATIAGLKADCARDGSRLVLMVIPAKEQVYWPLLERTFSRATIQEAVDFYCRYNNMPLRAEAVSAQRLALNQVVRDLSAQENLPLLDLTDALTSAAAEGREVYFPDDTHWNEIGHDIAARALAKFLALSR
ncbi:MAG: alginate O-acetyltransferase AlgX-related protein [Chthoniobacterales bacterium]